MPNEPVCDHGHCADGAERAYPTNFAARDGLLWYIDYECNAYMEEWSFDHWGVRYWSRTPEFEQALAEQKRQEEEA